MSKPLRRSGRARKKRVIYDPSHVRTESEEEELESKRDRERRRDRGGKAAKTTMAKKDLPSRNTLPKTRSANPFIRQNQHLYAPPSASSNPFHPRMAAANPFMRAAPGSSNPSSYSTPYDRAPPERKVARKDAVNQYSSDSSDESDSSAYTLDKAASKTKQKDHRRSGQKRKVGYHEQDSSDDSDSAFGQPQAKRRRPEKKHDAWHDSVESNIDETLKLIEQLNNKDSDVIDFKQNRRVPEETDQSSLLPSIRRLS